jgi:hypothetical protein
MKKTLPDLAGLLDGLAKAGSKEDEMSVRDMRDTVGRRSFAPLLLTTSLIGFTPLGGVPGVPTALAILIVLIAAQIVLGRQSLWLPSFLLDRKVKGRKVQSAAKSLQPFARLVDKAIRPRLTFLTERPSSYVLAIACILIAVTVPPLELVPFVDMPLWAALAAFALALAAHDGLLAIAAFILTATGLTLVCLALL